MKRKEEKRDGKDLVEMRTTLYETGGQK